MSLSSGCRPEKLRGLLGYGLLGYGLLGYGLLVIDIEEKELERKELERCRKLAEQPAIVVKKL
jgi:hypothetical protein